MVEQKEGKKQIRNGGEGTGKKHHQQAKDDFEKTHVIQWDVPLSQFHVDRRLYHPKPALWSPIATVNTDRLTLRWQLSLEQGREDARCYLHHQTPEIPNQGVNFTVFALRQDGSSASLTAAVRGALNYAAGIRAKSTGDVFMTGVYEEDLSPKQKSRFTCGPQKTNNSNKSSWLQSARYNFTGVEKLIWDGDTVKIRVVVGISNRLWSPQRILEQKIRDWRQEEESGGKGFGMGMGLIGESLWKQVKYLRQATDEVPPSTDLILECPSGERVAAHKSVVAALSSSFRRMALGGQGGGVGAITMTSSGIGAAALWEVLHFMYLRTVSPEFHKAPLNELLEAVHIFQLPKILNCEVEKVFTQIVDAQNRGKMKVLAEQYGLNVVMNMIKKVERDVGEYDSRFDAVEREAELNQQSSALVQQN